MVFRRIKNKIIESYMREKEHKQYILFAEFGDQKELKNNVWLATIRIATLPANIVLGPSLLLCGSLFRSRKLTRAGLALFWATDITIVLAFTIAAAVAIPVIIWEMIDNFP